VPTIQDVLGQIRGQIREVTPAEARAMLDGGTTPVLLDVRDKEEFNEGHIPGAIHVPRSFLELRVENTVPVRSTPIVAYCAGGSRSLLAADSLRRMGYTNVLSMVGGFNRWRSEGFDTVCPRVLSPADVKRYERHLMVPEIGEAGQIKLLDARVLLIGAGGIGSAAAYYLAAAGIGKLGIVDFDVVDETNLQRQILHNVDSIGVLKTESASKTLRALNPGVEIETFNVRICSSNVEDIFTGYDLVVDGSDNFPTRYSVNDACVKFGIPNVHGSVYRFEGQVTVFYPPRGPCYRCLYPEPPPPELAPSCAEAGVLGVVPGIVGLLEAVEAVKLVIGKGDPLIGRLIHYDALKAEFRTLKLRRDPECRYCADGVPFPGFSDYEQFCTNPRSA
jgi:molybdopterin/thiamine biosynthesis adenylyltransferase/rhodanese-related sulfurtransferase